jgi:drug/metabolite transporter (DMT)-like permease
MSLAMARRVPLGVRHMLAAAFFFSLMSLLVKLAGRRLPSSEIVFARSLFSLVISYVMVRRAGLATWGRRKPLLLLRGLAGFGGLTCFFYAVTRLPLADVTVIHFTNPVFTAIFAALFLRERLGSRELSGLAVSLGGVVLVARPSFLFGGAVEGLNLFAAGVALLGAALAAVAYTTVRKLGETEHPLVVVFFFPLVATPASVPLMMSERALWPTPLEWLALVGVGVVTQIAQIHLTKGLHAERAGRAMSISYVQILFAAFWGAAVFGEIPDIWTAGGAALVVAGTLLVARGGRDAMLPRGPGGGPAAGLEDTHEASP